MRLPAFLALLAVSAGASAACAPSAPVAAGTPLRAVAPGTLIAFGSSRADGEYFWLQHAPRDTGLGYWLYARYDHLSQQTPLGIGEHVHRGQVLARSGEAPSMPVRFFAASTGDYRPRAAPLAPRGARALDASALLSGGALACPVKEKQKQKRVR